MTKQEIQKRVSKNGKSLSLDDFEWDEKTNTFSSVERLLVSKLKRLYTSGR